MIIAFLILAVLAVFCELYLSFIFIPSQYGLTYYVVRIKYAAFIYNGRTGYQYKPLLRRQSSMVLYKKAPRKIEFKNFRTNKQGFVGEDEMDTLKAKKLIFCIGGSTTAGAESDYRKTYPAQLDTLVRPYNYRCVNAGLGGCRSIHELLTLRHRVLTYKPRAIILWSGYNDYEAFSYKMSAPFDPFTHYLTSVLPRNKIEETLCLSAAYFIFRKKLGLKTKIAATDVHCFQESLDNPQWLPEWKENVGKIIALCRQHTIPIFLVNTFTPAFAGASVDVKKQADNELAMSGCFDQSLQYAVLINQETRLIATTLGATYIDVIPHFETYLSQFKKQDYVKQRLALFIDRIHFTEYANEILSRAIFAGIQESMQLKDIS